MRLCYYIMVNNISTGWDGKNTKPSFNSKNCLCPSDRLSRLRKNMWHISIKFEGQTSNYTDVLFHTHLFKLFSEGCLTFSTQHLKHNRMLRTNFLKNHCVPSAGRGNTHRNHYVLPTNPHLPHLRDDTAVCDKRRGCRRLVESTVTEETAVPKLNCQTVQRRWLRWYETVKPLKCPNTHVTNIYLVVRRNPATPKIWKHPHHVATETISAHCVFFWGKRGGVAFR